MEKASTPRNRLTRSSAKQVNTPKSIDQEDSVGKNPGPEIKPNVRKTRRKYDTKAKANGDTNVENKMNDGDGVEYLEDRCEQDDLNFNDKSQDTPKTNTQKTPSPNNLRRSLRPRRSITPGPELEASASKKMRRSSSFGKLDSVSTPTKRKMRRAVSESKDFVFSPSKECQSGSQDTNGKYVPISSLRIIEKIEEVNEGEKSGEEEGEADSQEVKSSNEIKSESKIIDSLSIGSLKDDIVKDCKLKSATVTSVIETDSSTDSKLGCSDNILSNLQNTSSIEDSSKTSEIPHNSSEVLSDVTENPYEGGEVNTTKVVESKSQLEPMSLSEVTDESSSIENIVQPDSSLPEIQSNNKDTDKSSSATENIEQSDSLPEIQSNNEDTDKSSSATENIGQPNTSLPETKTNNEDTDKSSSATENIGQPNTSLPETKTNNEDTDNSSSATEKIEQPNTSLTETQTNNLQNEKENKCEDVTFQQSETKDKSSENSDCEQLKSVIASDVTCNNGVEITVNSGDKNDNVVVNNDNKNIEFDSCQNYDYVEVDLDDVDDNHVDEDDVDDNHVDEDDVDEDDVDEDDDDDDDANELGAQDIKEIDEQLKSIIEEGKRESGDESRTPYSKSGATGFKKTHDETEGFDKIDLIISSDSDEGAEEKPEDSYKKGFMMEKNKPTIKENDDYTLLLRNDPQTFHSFSSEHGHQGHEEVTEKGLKLDAIAGISHIIDNNCEKMSNESRIGLVDRLKNKGNPTHYYMDSEPCNIVIENPHSLAIDDSVPINSISDSKNKNVGNSSLEDQCTDLDPINNVCKQNEAQENELNGSSSGLKEHGRNLDHLPEKESKTQTDDTFYEDDYSEDHFDENYEDEEYNKSEEGSCDIYKGLSDSGSYDDEKKEGSQSGDSVSSELQSGSGNSEDEFATSVDEEEDENVKGKNRLMNELYSGSIEQAKEILRSKDGEKLSEKNPDSPMTYDKALAIINKNRVRKIDDEEFFDMFTEELNRVSEQSGSDSDIAIVDEYLLEPEEPAKKTQPKSGNSQNVKQPPKQPPRPPVLTNETMPPDNYHPGTLNQPFHAQHGNVLNPNSHSMTAQHSNSAMQRMNFAQTSGHMYNLDQNMHLRGPMVYNQYAHPSSSMQDPHMFNVPVPHPDANFSRPSGVYNHSHPLHPGSELPYSSNSTTLKTRTVTDLNSMQSLGHEQYCNLDQVPLNTQEEGEFEHNEDNYMNMNSVADVHKVDTGGSRRTSSDTAKHHEFSNIKGQTSKTPIIDLLGLDEKALKLLKKVLGLNSIKRDLIRLDPEWRKKCLEKNIRKCKLRTRGRKNLGRDRNLKRPRESESSSQKSSSDQSSEESSITSSDVSKRSSCGSSSENDREVDIEDHKVFVTLKPRHRNKHSKHRQISEKSQQRLRNNERIGRKRRSSEVELGSKKVTKKLPVLVQSQCGTFTVDPLTASSQSSDSESTTMNDKQEVRRLKKQMKRDLALGKNKLSNIFAQHSLKKPKLSGKDEPEPFEEEEIKGPFSKKKLKKIKKLPSGVLETLAKEEKRKKRQRPADSGSDEILERPKKIKKKNQRMKVKSKAGDQCYIPFLTGGATEFSLGRLDKEGTLTLAEKAANFRTERLYGSPVKRITILDFKHQWC